MKRFNRKFKAFPVIVTDCDMYKRIPCDESHCPYIKGCLVYPKIKERVDFT